MVGLREIRVNRLKVKLDLINRGYEYKPSRYQKNGDVILSFSLPRPLMRKFKKLALQYGSGRDVIENFIDLYIPNKPIRQTGKVFYGSDLSSYCENYDIEVKEYKHKDYLFTSASISEETFNQIESIKTMYGITRSQVIRLMIEAIK